MIKQDLPLAARPTSICALLPLLVLFACQSEPKPGPPPVTVDPEVALPQLRRIHAAEQPSVDLRVEYASVALNGQRAFLRTYNGALVGPTLRVRPGETLRVNLTNALPDDPADPAAGGGHAGHGGHGSNTPHGFNVTNLHTHGLHVRPDVPARCADNPSTCDAVGDNVLVNVLPGASQRYEIEVPLDHPPGTYWYHAHKHGSVAMQLASGMAGFLIVEGGLDEVPGIQNAPEQLLAFQQLRLTTCGRAAVPTAEADPRCIAPDETAYESCDQFFSRLTAAGVLPPVEAGSACVENFNFIFGVHRLSTVLEPRFGYRTSINGTVMPTIEMKQGEVQRWRTLHAGVMESLSLGLVPAAALESQQAAGALVSGAAQRVPLHAVAYDGIATGRIDTLDSLSLEPGYRADVLVRVDQPGDYLLIDLATAATEALHAEAEPASVLARVRVLPSDAPAGAFPSAEALAPLAPFKHVEDKEIAGCQYATFNFGTDSTTQATTFTVNGQPFDMAHEPRRMSLGSADEWVVNSGMGNHPFHIHVNPFELQEDYGPFKAGTWKDTLLVNEADPARIRTRYEDFTGDFVLHCHILNHEDQGMMQLVSVVPPGVPNSACPISTQPGQPLCLASPPESGACTAPTP